jgi:hypothetical protein
MEKTLNKHIPILLAASTALAITAGCGSSPKSNFVEVSVPEVVGELLPRNRYKFNQDCVVLKSAETGNYVTAARANYSASASEVAEAEPFFMMPAALGEYLLYNRNRELLSGGESLTSAELDTADSENGGDNIFVVKTENDAQLYPSKPIFVPDSVLPVVEPSLAWTTEYHEFEDDNPESTRFTFVSERTGDAITAAGDGSLSTAAYTGGQNQIFVPESVTGCAEFPEASSNTSGESFSGTVGPDNYVLGMVDAHVHISSTSFLGKAQAGFPFHPFGVTHALADCAEVHGEMGSMSAVEAVFSEDIDGHVTAGWPTFPNWPARNNLFHEAIYWKWVERSWKSGLRIVVNDLVDNETLCEMSRNAGLEPTLDCNSMNNAGRQAYTMWAMQDYIDAQYGGRGEGFFQIALDDVEARELIEAGKLAVILGIEISNLSDCKVNYNPARTQEPLNETGGGENGTENTYTSQCTEGQLQASIDRMKGWGVRQVITIHEFDNAFGGNGIFDGLVLNAGSRENSGGIPGGVLSNPSGTVTSGPPELPSGEFWTTLSCPNGDDTEWSRGPDDTSPAEPFDGYIFNGSGGTNMASLGTCFFQGQGAASDPISKRPGGPTPCYPAVRQCNARWLTPVGLTFYSLLMENGLIFDIDHLAIKMKSQALDLAELHTPPYPFVSTHGNFGGTTKHQARRILANGGLIYPSIGRTYSSTPTDGTFLTQMSELRGLWTEAGAPGIFGFGFGTDTNGLSAQASPRKGATEAITYPYTLFDGGVWEDLPELRNLGAVVFEQPSVTDVVTGLGRTWHVDSDGSAHYGMMASNVQEVVIEGSDEDLRDMFMAAENYLQMWAQTLASQRSIIGEDGQGAIDVDAIKGDILKQAPLPDSPFSTGAPAM